MRCQIGESSDRSGEGTSRACQEGIDYSEECVLTATEKSKENDRPLQINNMEVEYNLQDSCQNQHNNHRPFFFGYLPRLVRFDDAPMDATGCATDMYARSTVFMASIFLGPALLELASKAAQQQCNDMNNNLDEEVGCDSVRVHGFKPSSLLSNIAIVGGLISTIVLPVFGAIVDHTPYRRQVGAWTAVGLTVIKAVETVFLLHWFFVACLQIGSVICFQLHIVAVYAYSAELSAMPTTQSRYQTYFFTSMYVSMILYMLEVLIPGTFWGLDDMGTARWAVGIATFTCVPLFFLCWKFLFRDCPPQRQVPTGQSLWTAGFAKLQCTYHAIRHGYPSVAIFLQTMMFSEAANSALATIATTYLSEFLGMNSLEIGGTIFTVLVFGLPGSWLGHMFCHWYDPVVSTKFCLILYILTTTFASLTLVPRRKRLAYLYGALWGVCQGWMHPQHTTIFVTMLMGENSVTVVAHDGPPTSEDNNMNDKVDPSPQNEQQGAVELMGVFLFASQILSFLPPLVFTSLNEVGVSMEWGMASLVIYFVIGYWGLVQMGDYQAILSDQMKNDGAIYFGSETENGDKSYEGNSASFASGNGILS